MHEPTHASPVRSHTEWDLLEEVVVGIVDDARFPPWHPALEPVLPAHQHDTFRRHAGEEFPAELVKAADAELEELVRVLEGEGVTVRRPEALPQDQPYATPAWTSTGMYAAMPRDALLVVGDQIIECPMAWRSRYYENLAYRPLIKEYFHGGARWAAGPKPELTDAQYDLEWTDPGEGAPARLVVTEFEPTFDAADFLRFGRDIIGQRSNVTNDFGIEWLRRCLGDEYRVRIMDFDDAHPMHIDATIMPLKPGLMLVNPERAPRALAERMKRSLFKGWDLVEVPRPVMPDDHCLYMTSKWINMNVVSIDEERVLVEAEDAPMAKFFKNLGLKPIPVPFRHFNTFGGSFHCATCDVRRVGGYDTFLGDADDVVTAL